MPLGPNHVNMTALEAKMVLQIYTYDGEMRHGIGKSVLPDMSSTMLSWETLWNMGTKALIQDQKFVTIEWHQA